MENILGKRLKVLREEHDWLQKDIAEKLGLSSSGYGYYESGKRVPDAITLQRICDIFKVDADYLLGRSDSKTKVDLQIALNTFSSEGLDDDDIEMVKGLIENLKKKNQK